MGPDSMIDAKKEGKCLLMKGFCVSYGEVLIYILVVCVADLSLLLFRKTTDSLEP